MKQDSKFLFVVAHPDDEVITCGGLLGDVGRSSHLLLATNRYDDMELVYERIKVFKEVVSFVGATYDNLKLEAYKFSHTQTDAIQRIRDIAKDRDIIVTHHPMDFNRDHAELSKMVVLATRDLPCSVWFMNSYAPERVDNFNGTIQYKYSSSKKKGELIDLYKDVRYNKYFVLCKDSMNSSDGKSYIELYEPYRVSLNYESFITKFDRADNLSGEDA